MAKTKEQLQLRIHRLESVLDEALSLLAFIRYQDWPTIGLGINLSPETMDEVLLEGDKVLPPKRARNKLKDHMISAPQSKQVALDRVLAHFKNIEPEMQEALSAQLRQMIGPMLDMIGKPEDTEQVIAEFVTEFMPMSVARSRETLDLLHTEEELDILADFWDKNPWAMKKSITFSRLHNENINKEGNEICSRILSRYEPSEETT